MSSYVVCSGLGCTPKRIRPAPGGAARTCSAAPTRTWNMLAAATAPTTCPWKGIASYYDVVVNGESNRDAAWYYPEPKEAARNIKGHVAFWRGVKVEV